MTELLPEPFTLDDIAWSCYFGFTLGLVFSMALGMM